MPETGRPADRKRLRCRPASKRNLAARPARVETRLAIADEALRIGADRFGAGY
jgi:hypothetical protein